MWSVLKKMPDGTVDMSSLNLKYNLINLKKIIICTGIF